MEEEEEEGEEKEELSPSQRKSLFPHSLEARLASRQQNLAGVSCLREFRSPGLESPFSFCLCPPGTLSGAHHVQNPGLASWRIRDHAEGAAPSPRPAPPPAA